MDINQLLDLLEAHYEQTGRPCLRSMRYQVRALRAAFGAQDAGTLKPTEIQAYHTARRAMGRSAATIRNELWYLRRAYRVAKLYGEDVGEPYIALPRSRARRTGFVTPEQFRRLYGALEALCWPVSQLCLWAYLLGRRQGELRALLWRRVDREEGVVIFAAEHSKTSSTSTIPLSPRLQLSLGQLWVRADGEWVFHRRGRPIKDFRGAWRRACGAAGIPQARPHDLRRSFARNARRSGLPTQLIMALAGWRTDDTFRRYDIVDEADMRRGLRTVEQFSV